jgi:hypothetical protein
LPDARLFGLSAVIALGTNLEPDPIRSPIRNA